MARYAVNEAAVARPRADHGQAIRPGQRLGRVQPRADDENAFLEKHSWEEYAAWHLGLTEGANDETKARYALRVRRLPAAAPHRPHRLRLPGLGVAAQAVELAAHDLLQELDRVAGIG